MQMKIPAYSVEELAEIRRSAWLRGGVILSVKVNEKKGQRYEVTVSFPEKKGEAYS